MKRKIEKDPKNIKIDPEVYTNNAEVFTKAQEIALEHYKSNMKKTQEDWYK